MKTSIAVTMTARLPIVSSGLLCMGRGFGGGMGTATSSTINVGTLGIDFFDLGTKNLVWRGL